MSDSTRHHGAPSSAEVNERRVAEAQTLGGRHSRHPIHLRIDSTRLGVEPVDEASKSMGSADHIATAVTSSE